MKRFVLLLSLSGALQSVAQQSETQMRPKPSFRINGYGGYTFSDKYDYYYSAGSYYEGQVNSGVQWGAGFEWMPMRSVGVELTYLREDTESPTTYTDGTQANPVRTTNFDLGTNYVFLGVTKYFRVSPVFEPYVGAQAGMAFVSVKDPDNGYSSSGSKFAWAIKGGTNLWVSPRFGIKLQTGFSSITKAVGGDLYFSPYGVVNGFSGYSTIFRFSLGGGVVFKLAGS